MSDVLVTGLARTLGAIAAAWVPFRAVSLEQTLTMLNVRKLLLRVFLFCEFLLILNGAHLLCVDRA